MMHQYAIHASHQVVCLSGPVPAALEDWCATLDTVFMDPTYTPGFDFLSDRRGSTVLPSDAYVLDAIRYLQAHRPQLDDCRWALVTDSDPIDGWARLAALIGGSVGLRFGVFEQIDAAWHWLRKSGAAP